MSEAWKKQDRPCPPCPDCGADLYEKFWGGGGWAKTDKATERAHDSTDCVVAMRAHLARLHRAEDILVGLLKEARDCIDRLETIRRPELLERIDVAMQERGVR